MESIANLPTQDGYTDALTLGPLSGTQKVAYLIANASAVVQLAAASASGTINEWGPEILLTPTTGEFQRCQGMRFRSAVPGSPAQIVAMLISPADPIPIGGTPFTDELTSQGTIIPVSGTGITVFNVKDYGAKGDGHTDDTASIQAAITAAQNNANGGIVFFPAGLYMVSSTLAVRSPNIALWGAGAGNEGPGGVVGTSVIRPTAAFVGAMVLDVRTATPNTQSLSSMHLQDIEIDGALAPANVDGIWLGCYRSYVDRVTVWRMTGRGCVVDGGGSTVFPLGAWDIIFQGCNFSANDGNGLHFQNESSDNSVLGCIVGQNGGDNITIDPLCPGQRIVGCYLQNATGWHINAGEVGQLSIVGNRMREAGLGAINLAPVHPVGIGFNITGNTFKNCSEGGDNLTDGITVNPTGGGTIEGGTIGPNNFCTNDANRMRYAVNIANANAQDIAVDNQSYSFVAPATRCYGTAAIQNLGTRTRIAPITLAQSAVQASHTGDLLETALATVTVPGGLMGANGRLRVTATFSRNGGGTSATTVRLHYSGIGGTSYLNVSPTVAQIVDHLMTEIANRGAQNSQVGSAAVGLGTGGALVTSAVDSSQDQTLVLTGQLATNTDSVALEKYVVEVLPG